MTKHRCISCVLGYSHNHCLQKRPPSSSILQYKWWAWFHLLQWRCLQQVIPFVLHVDTPPPLHQRTNLTRHVSWAILSSTIFYRKSPLMCWLNTLGILSVFEGLPECWRGGTPRVSYGFIRCPLWVLPSCGWLMCNIRLLELHRHAGYDVTSCTLWLMSFGGW
jgi:hypothetical protein